MALQYNLDETEAQCRQPRGLSSLVTLLNDVGADIAEQLKVYSLDTLSESHGLLKHGGAQSITFDHEWSLYFFFCEV